jgi:hypothetical protein
MAMVEYGDEPTMHVSNEFADIRIRTAYTRNGERLQIESPRRGFQILLDAVQLESLTWQSPETFSRFLRASVGRDEEQPPDL